MPLLCYRSLSRCGCTLPSLYATIALSLPSFGLRLHRCEQHCVRFMDCLPTTLTLLTPSLCRACSPVFGLVVYVKYTHFVLRRSSSRPHSVQPRQICTELPSTDVIRGRRLTLLVLPKTLRTGGAQELRRLAPKTYDTVRYANYSRIACLLAHYLLTCCIVYPPLPSDEEAHHGLVHLPGRT